MQNRSCGRRWFEAGFGGCAFGSAATLGSMTSLAALRMATGEKMCPLGRMLKVR
jgi:hypothetical protein